MDLICDTPTSISSKRTHEGICSDFTFVWKIINISHCVVSRNGRMESPAFPYILRINNLSEWQLYIYPRSGYRGNVVVCELKNRRGTSEAEINCYFCVCTLEQELLYGEERVIIIPERHLPRPNQVLASFKRDIFEKLPDDTVVLHVHMWTYSYQFCQNKYPVHFFTETRLNLERHIFEVLVKDFSSLQLGEEKASATLYTMSNSVIHLRILVSGRNLIDASVEIRLYYENLAAETFSTCALWFMNKNGKVIKCDRKEFLLDSSNMAENVKKFSIRRQEILSGELSEDILVLRGEVTLSGNSSPWDQVVYSLQTTEAVKAAMSPRCLEVPRLQPSSPPSSKCESFTLSTDMRSLLKGEGPPFDLEIIVGRRSFQVHQLVLEARSRVFRAMLVCEGKKKKPYRHLELNDVDEGTAEKMLLYAYTDEAPSSELEFEALVNLYAAADEYDLMGLMHICSQQMVKKMNLTNAPTILEIAERHKDLHLKKEIVNFFDSLGLAALESENWKKLEQRDSKLANEVLRLLISKRCEQDRGNCLNSNDS